MEKNFTFFAKTMTCFLATIISLLFTSVLTKTYAQVGCTNETVLFLETFGTGSTATSSPDVIPTALRFLGSGLLDGEGTYRVINNTQQRPEWQNSQDHTPNDVDGKMLVINGQAETFYNHEIDRSQGFQPGSYSVSLYIMNVDTLGVCGVDALLPNINFRVEYLSETSTWEPLNGSPYEAAPVPQTASSSPTWVQLGSSFVLPPTGGFVVKNIRIVLADGTVGGCGNDFAMDDIKFSSCPEAGPTPVKFLSINARQSGNGVNILWSTAQEINSKSFAIEKSADGNSNWSTVASLNAAGNSFIVKNYNGFDPTPFKGANFYRIKQFDIDGNFTYSKTVMININSNQTSVSVLANPFYNSLTVNFSSGTNQSVKARLIDITGKQVAVEKWSINPGSSTKEFSNINGLQPGMYILNVSGNGGEILYNNKVIKQ